MISKGLPYQAMLPAPTTRTLVNTLSLVLGLGATLALTHSEARAQGCVAIKQMGDTLSTMGGLEMVHDTEKWDLTVSYQHFRSHRHYVGTEEQRQRYTQGS